MVLILIGVLAGMTPAANAYIDLNNLGRTAAGMVWLKLIIATGGLSIGVYTKKF